MPIMETRCKYKEGAKYGDILLIETSLKELSPVKVLLTYNIKRKNDQKLLAKGETVQAFVDKEKFKIINLKRNYPEVYEKFQKLL
ncbi:MAG TPA: hypothetical protein DGK91_09325 [Clostridium sp.]|nr:hypothetical protein [Clostridium sp.]